jgi:tRNA A-37 threonylcarbamoyl transferase component Bud32/membrane-associated phospholipid phosphatase
MSIVTPAHGRPGATTGGRRRRPTGAPPPLPRQIGASGRVFIAGAVVMTVWVVLFAVAGWARELTEQVDAAVLRGFARIRADWAVTAARGIDRMATGWTLSAIGFALLVATMVFRRWRHVFAFLGSVLVLELAGLVLTELLHRPRPFDVTAAGRWRGYSMPSVTVAIVALVVVGILSMLVVPGRPRSIGAVIGGVVIGLVIASRLLLGIDHPFDILVALAFGVAVPLMAFRWFTPNSVVPVRYSRGKTAHLDVTGRRGEAIRRAVEEQIGVSLTEVKPFGLAGSGGSTPLRLTTVDGRQLFGKLYAMNHVRSDRWYKLGRTVLYGRLEDEAPFKSVRRLVQQEDYTLRLMRDAGVPTAEPMGIVELTPEREYMLVTSFLDGAVELGDAEVDDTIIDEGLQIVRRMWDTGLAHRDIKPANLLVRDGHLSVIDVAFAQVRPSPWREAVDLANMMLVLAVRTDAERVYDRALLVFTPDEIAEAFAATSGIASPTQLRSAVKQDGRDLVAEFRALAPPRPKISLQRWSVRRVLLAVAVFGVLVLFAIGVYSMFTPARLPVSGQPECATSDVVVLMAQAVPTATEIPCLQAEPAGLSDADVLVDRGDARFTMTDRDGRQAVAVHLRDPARCIPGTTERVEGVGEEVRLVRTIGTAGSCTAYELVAADREEVAELEDALGTISRRELVAAVSHDTHGLVLCGVGAPPCVGATD